MAKSEIEIGEHITKWARDQIIAPLKKSRKTDGVINREKCIHPERVARIEDYDIVTTFAHLTPNFTIDELFGYFRLVAILRESDFPMKVMSIAYDMTTPRREKPEASKLQTGMHKLDPCILHEAEKDKPIAFQRVIDELELPDPKAYRTICCSGAQADIYENRLRRLFEFYTRNFDRGKRAVDYLISVRKDVLMSLSMGIIEEVPFSSIREMFAKRLEDDWETGTPFWGLDMPPEWEKKHKTNNPGDGTYLLWGINEKHNFVPVKFEEGKFRFRYSDSGFIDFRPEESFEMLREGRIHPTTFLLTHFFTSSSLKYDDRSARQIHIGGPYMAGENGYGKQVTNMLKRQLGDRKGVKLVFTGYDGRGSVRKGDIDLIGVGVTYPTYGEYGLIECFNHSRLSLGEVHMGSKERAADGGWRVYS